MGARGSYGDRVVAWGRVARGVRAVAAAGDLGRPGPRDPVADRPTLPTVVLLVLDLAVAVALVFVVAVSARTSLRVVVAAVIVLLVVDAGLRVRRLRTVFRRRRELRARHG